MVRVSAGSSSESLNQNAEIVTPKKPPAIFRAIEIIQQGSLQTAEVRDFHIIDQEDDYYLGLEVVPADNEYGLTIRRSCYASFEELPRYFTETPETKEEFLDDITGFPIIQTNEDSCVETDTEETSKFYDFYEYGHVDFQLSNELQRGLNGERGDDHKIEYITFFLCLDSLANKHKIKKINNQTNALGQEFHFNDLTSSPS